MKLTPWDSELLLMVESLTGKHCVARRGDGDFFFEVDYSCNRDPDFICAIIDAITGRLGKRLVSMKDDPDRDKLFVFVRYSEENLPEMVEKRSISEPNPEVGNLFIKRFGSGRIRAINVTRANLGRLITFVGNGSFTIYPDNSKVFEFLNAGSVFKKAPEYSYVVHVRDDLFEVVEEEIIDKEWVRLF